MIVLQVAYDGTLFSGSQRQPDAHTVENNLINAFYAVELFQDMIPDTFRMVSRTDKGVSARENYLFMEGESKSLFKNNRIERVNRSLDGIWITGYCNAQYAPPYEKQYRYYLNEKDMEDPLLEKACSLLSGTHDYSNFSKPNPFKTTVRTVTMSCEKVGDTWRITFQGKGFLWQMCRRLVSAASLYAGEEITFEELESLFDPKTKGFIPPSDPRHLILYSINIESKILPIESGIEKMRSYYSSRLRDYSSLLEQYRDICDNVPPTSNI